MRLLALYFSGTGNTEYAVSRFCSHFKEVAVFSIEDEDAGSQYPKDFDAVLIAYPIYGSDMPRLIKEFLKAHKTFFESKNIITLVTQLAFSGDGGALAVRYLKRQKVKSRHLASIHLNMPNNVSDMFFLKVKNGDENKSRITKANKKIDKCTASIIAGKKVRNGRLFFFSRFAGLFGQRMIFRFVEGRMAKRLKIDLQKCNLCGLCVKICPADNITYDAAVPKAHKKCALCYRCINQCAQKAISLFSKRKPKKQFKGMSFD